MPELSASYRRGSAQRGSSVRQQPLVALISAIDRAVEAMGGSEGPEARSALLSALGAASVTPGLLSHAQRKPGADCYARHVIHADPAGRYTLIAIVWAPGQFSPIHAHRAWCAYSICDGPLCETLFRIDPVTGAAIELGSHKRPAGYACFADAGLDQIHRLGNDGRIGAAAVSLHAYGVSGDNIACGVNDVIDV